VDGQIGSRKNWTDGGRGECFPLSYYLFPSPCFIGVVSCFHGGEYSAVLGRFPFYVSRLYGTGTMVTQLKVWGRSSGSFPFFFIRLHPIFWALLVGLVSHFRLAGVERMFP
jgi:hypothetical protein